MESEQRQERITSDLVEFATKAQNVGLFAPQQVQELVEFFKIRTEYRKLDQMGSSVDQEALLSNLERGNTWLENHMDQPDLMGWFFGNY